MQDTDMKRIADAHTTKASKVRALNKAGVSTSDISRFLGIRYQHSYNILLRAGRIGKAESIAAEARSAVIALTVDANGAVTLPASLLESLKLGTGDKLYCRETPDGVLLMPRDRAAAELAKVAAEHMPEHATLLSALLDDRLPDHSGTL